MEGWALREAEAEAKEERVKRLQKLSESKPASTLSKIFEFPGNRVLD